MTTIGDIARRAGIRTSAIRYYEQIGLLPAPARVGGRRRYTESALLRLAVIRFARDNGFTLAEIRRLFAGKPYSTRLRGVATAKIAELESTITRARVMQAILGKALRCKCLTLEECGRRIAAGQDRRGRGTPRP
jgi:MerR family redox-sensitive transcriptional activator SoxR